MTLNSGGNAKRAFYGSFTKNTAYSSSIGIPLVGLAIDGGQMNGSALITPKNLKLSWIHIIS